MPDYFFVLERNLFDCLLSPALGEAWLRRSFACCRELAATLTPPALAFAQRYHVDPTALLLPRLKDGLPFDRELWRQLVSECLLVAACDVPEFPAHLDSIVYLLTPDHFGAPLPERPHLPPPLQAL